jgi:hypothetical protein
MEADGAFGVALRFSVLPIDGLFQFGSKLAVFLAF